MIEYEILEVIQGNGAALFNYAFTVVSVFGFVSLLIGALCSIISRS